MANVRRRKTKVKVPKVNNPEGVASWLKIVLVVGGLFGVGYGSLKLYQYFKTSENLTSLNKKEITLTKNQAKNFCSRVITDAEWFNSDAKIYVDLDNLSDVDLKFVFNTFIKEFGDQTDHRTMLEFIQQEKINNPEGMEIIISRLIKIAI